MDVEVLVGAVVVVEAVKPPQRTQRKVIQCIVAPKTCLSRAKAELLPWYSKHLEDNKSWIHVVFDYPDWCRNIYYMKCHWTKRIYMYILYIMCIHHLWNVESIPSEMLAKERTNLHSTYIRTSRLKPLSCTVAWMPSSRVHTSHLPGLCSMPLQLLSALQACLHSCISSITKGHQIKIWISQGPTVNSWLCIAVEPLPLMHLEEGQEATR